MNYLISNARLTIIDVKKKKKVWFLPDRKIEFIRLKT